MPNLNSITRRVERVRAAPGLQLQELHHGVHVNCHTLTILQNIFQSFEVAMMEMT